MRYIIYCIKNKINNKVYIGYTSKTIQERFLKHIKNAENKINRRLYDSMNHHGFDNFEIIEIDECDDKSKAEEMESWYIYIFKSKEPDRGYNMTWGGDGGHTLAQWSEEDRKKLYQRQAENRKRNSLEKYGVTSPTKIKEVRDKISKSRKGKIISDEIRKKISDSHKKLGTKPPTPSWANETHPFFGKKHTKESKKKISDARRGKKYEDLFDAETTNRLKEQRKKFFSGNLNPRFVENLNIKEQKEFIKLLISGKKISDCSIHFNKSEYKLRQLLRMFGIDNIQKLRNEDIENNKLNYILKNYE